MFLDKIYGRWMAAMQKEKMEKILEEVGLENLEGKNILDVGSGPSFLSGIFRKSLKNVSVVSCDIDLENLTKTKGLRVLASGNFLPFRKVFDFIFCIDTVHLLDGKGIGKEFAGILKDNGLLIISAFCNRYNSGEKMKRLEGLLGGLKIEKRFIARTENEWDAVVVGMLKYSKM